MTIDEILNELISLQGVEYGPGAGPAEVSAAEHSLGASLPGSFKTYLSRVGWMSVGGDEYFGLGAGVAPFADLVNVTQQERTDAWPPLPTHLIPLMNDGGGNHHCLDLSRATTEDAPVVFWDHEHEDGPQQVPSDWAPSFSAWLEVRLREATDKASGEGG